MADTPPSAPLPANDAPPHGAGSAATCCARRPWPAWRPASQASGSRASAIRCSRRRLEPTPAGGPGVDLRRGDLEHARGRARPPAPQRARGARRARRERRRLPRPRAAGARPRPRALHATCCSPASRRWRRAHGARAATASPPWRPRRRTPCCARSRRTPRAWSGSRRCSTSASRRCWAIPSTAASRARWAGPGCSTPCPSRARARRAGSRWAR